MKARAMQAKCTQKGRVCFDPDKESEYGHQDKETNLK